MKITLRNKNWPSVNGFALIATISVMVLLVMIALAMLSLSTIELRQAGYTSHQQEARANARMALMIALGDLQKYAGPDTRVTAKASLQVPGTENPHYVGVYKTRLDEDLSSITSPTSGSFVVDHHEGDLFLTDIRGDDKVEPLTYLVSQNDNFDPHATLASADSVVILDTGDIASSVRVPLVDVNGSRYAYWVSDNSTKLLYNHANPHSREGASSASASLDEYYGASVVQSMNLDGVTIDGSNPLDEHSSLESATLEKGVSLDTSRLIFSNLTDEQLKKSFHTITGDSAAVFANPIVGGLKPDLTAFIEQGDINPSTDDRGKNLTPMLTSTPIIKGDHHNMTSPRFGVLKDWADMRFKLSSNSGDASISPQVSKDSFRQTFSQSLEFKRRDVTKVEGNYIQPVVVEASLGWDWSPYTEGSVEKLRTHVFPRLILWNPYNVTLEAKKYVMLTNTPAYGRLHYREVGMPKDSPESEGIRITFPTLIGMSKNQHGNPGWAFPGFVTESVSLAPGECKVFSPDMNNSSGTNLSGRARRFDPNNYANNVLSSEKAPSSDNFYWDNDTILETEETPENMNDYYGFSGNLNEFYSASERGSAEFIVLQSKSGSVNMVTPQILTSDDDYEAISHFLAQNNSETRYGKWYAAQHSQHAVNGFTYFRNISQWPSDRLPPRLWRRGMRLQWFDETAEGAAVKHYEDNPCHLTVPLVAAANLHGGDLNHPSPLGVRLQNGWQIPNMNGHVFFRQPTDPDELKSFFPPSPVGRPSDGYPTRIVLFDVPRKNPGIFSLGQFQHAQFSYLSWHPTFILGSSYTTDQSDVDATALRDRLAQTSSPSPFLVTDRGRWGSNSSSWGHSTYNANSIIQRNRNDSESTKTHGDEVLVYDISHELNHSFWDHYMLSGIPHQGGVNTRSIDWDGEEALPVSHYKPRPTSKLSIPEVVDALDSTPDFAFYHASEFLLNHGAINVNCDDKEVWKSYLLSLQNKKKPNLDNSQSGGSDTTSLTRGLLPPEGGTTSISSSIDEQAWNGFRSLTAGEIDRLAEELVKQVQQRGPFLSLSDFINRRLNKIPEQNYSGALQSAIDLAGINAGLEQDGGGVYASDRTSEVTDDMPSIKNRVDYKTALLPGYFSQNDLLTVLSPSLTARGDTFTIRAYGESRDASGKVIARAYCEAVVQRVPEYVDSSDDAIEPVRTYNEANHEWELNQATGSGSEGLSAVNLKFGRQFKIQKFRWLSPSEV